MSQGTEPGSGGTGRGTPPAPIVLAGRYEIGELLGRGGMAVVHAGRDLRLGRRVAIKMLRSDLARDPSFQERFRREATSAAALNHPSIVAVYDTGEDVVESMAGTTEHVPFIVMEHVPGRTLREVLHAEDRTPPLGYPATDPESTARFELEGGSHRGSVDTPATPVPLGVDQAVRVTIGVLSALAYSHRAGIVHRDIKPANVMLTASGGIKVMDFGIARAMADASAAMTQTQAVIGTAQYLSPEQARGEQVDARSDLYSCGCLLYELLTGRPPFIGDSPVSVAYQHVREEPQPPSAFNPQVGAALDQVVLHALAKDREHRYPDADSFRTDLQSAVQGLPVTAAPVTAATTAMPFVGAPAVAPSRQVLPPVGVPEAEPQEYDEPTRGRAAGYLALAIAVLAVFGLAAFLVTQVLDSGDEVTPVDVPSVVELTTVDAKALIEGAGLVYVEGESQNSESVPEDSIISQDPGAGTQAQPGDDVTVVVSLGVGEVQVPDLGGFSQADARAALDELDLTAANVSTEDHPSIPVDAVIRTDPPAGATVAEGSEVSLVVSSGEVTVPNLAGLNYLEARSQLAERGLTSQVTFEESAAVPADQVIRQDPPPGSVPQGESVSLFVASAPTPTPTSAPPQPAPQPAPTEPPPDAPGP